ncbi:Common central domain of tyrosinase [Geodermatophilus obscurus]|uniref:Common central domain of tyrosinase n=1 Tax=Geodermatophilus obscurus TaxID=1861 RepID=A0A1M7UXB1_9ACTN|nr:tyrosinase family protein [Geodermatophilus obscurus]SHN87671.1 Common central domain of tyrosinase [Geodermatophilus obscurus]
MADQVVSNPTYMEHIRHFFDDVDLEHMLARGIDLTTYPALRANAARVFQHTRPNGGDMPPDAGRRWSQERHTTFRNWIVTGFPLGTPQPQPVQAGTGTRIRKDARDLTDEEIATLRRAFQGLMDQPAQAPDSYFTWGGVHGLPAPFECLHHEDLFLPWHRVLLRRFEDALRTVPGCADVTLPFWDITAEVPQFLYTAPFDAYTLPAGIGAGFPAGYTTDRYSAAEVLSNVTSFGVPQQIAEAAAMFDWGKFRNKLEGAHDNGHPSTGHTMTDADVASYDPIFWLFHANWDRLWWEWQQTMSATTQWSFRSTITDGQSDFLTSGFDDLSPFGEKAAATIDLSATGVGYGLAHTSPPTDADLPRIPALAFGSVPASRRIAVGSERQASVRLKGVNRLAIPGTFEAILTADGVPVARQAFFQRTRPRECTGCREKGVVDLDFQVGVETVTGKTLGVTIEILSPGAERIGRTFPLSSCGDPTINIRLPLEDRT